jgi:hypothetical protein
MILPATSGARVLAPAGVLVSGGAVVLAVSGARFAFAALRRGAFHMKYLFLSKYSDYLKFNCHGGWSGRGCTKLRSHETGWVDKILN